MKINQNANIFVTNSTPLSFNIRLNIRLDNSIDDNEWIMSRNLHNHRSPLFLFSKNLNWLQQETRLNNVTNIQQWFIWISLEWCWCQSIEERVDVEACVKYNKNYLVYAWTIRKLWILICKSINDGGVENEITLYFNLTALFLTFNIIFLPFSMSTSFVILFNW
jgi:hypothetical protein